MVHVMYTASSDDRGTVQALARELDEAHGDGRPSFLLPCKSAHEYICLSANILYQLSPRHEICEIPSNIYNSVLHHLNITQPALNLRSYMAAPTPNSLALVTRATFFDYVVICGSRFRASRRSQNSQGPLVEVLLDDRGRTGVGELTDIVLLDQPRCGTLTLGVVKWLAPLNMNIHETVWQKL